jgi:Na+/H+ antiporter NhaB
MDCLVNQPVRSYHEFYENNIIYLSLLGLGSVNDILDMKLLEINEVKQVMRSEEMQKLRYNLLGVATND